MKRHELRERIFQTIFQYSFMGEEELESLKSDLVTPVKIALKDAIDDYLEIDDENSPMD